MTMNLFFSMAAMMRAATFSGEMACRLNHLREQSGARDVGKGHGETDFTDALRHGQRRRLADTARRPGDQDLLSPYLHVPHLS
jgi:hypothetical protein